MENAGTLPQAEGENEIEEPSSNRHELFNQLYSQNTDKDASKTGSSPSQTNEDVVSRLHKMGEKYAEKHKEMAVKVLKHETKDCTFKPKINSKSKYLKDTNNAHHHNEGMVASKRLYNDANRRIHKQAAAAQVATAEESRQHIPHVNHNLNTSIISDKSGSPSVHERLYIQGKQEKQRKMIESQQQRLSARELEELKACTFKPEVSNYAKKMKRGDHNEVFERNFQVAKQRQNKSQANSNSTAKSSNSNKKVPFANPAFRGSFKVDREKELKTILKNNRNGECTFTPDISQRSQKLARKARERKNSTGPKELKTTPIKSSRIRKPTNYSKVRNTKADMNLKTSDNIIIKKRSNQKKSPDSAMKTKIPFPSPPKMSLNYSIAETGQKPKPEVKTHILNESKRELKAEIEVEQELKPELKAEIEVEQELKPELKHVEILPSNPTVEEEIPNSKDDSNESTAVAAPVAEETIAPVEKVTEIKTVPKPVEQVDEMTIADRKESQESWYAKHGIDKQVYNAFVTEGILMIKHGRRGIPHPANVIGSDVLNALVYTSKSGKRKNIPKSAVLGVKKGHLKHKSLVASLNRKLARQASSSSHRDQEQNKENRLTIECQHKNLLFTTSSPKLRDEYMDLISLWMISPTLVNSIKRDIPSSVKVEPPQAPNNETTDIERPPSIKETIDAIAPPSMQMDVISAKTTIVEPVMNELSNTTSSQVVVEAATSTAETMETGQPVLNEPSNTDTVSSQVEETSTAEVKVIPTTAQTVDKVVYNTGAVSTETKTNQEIFPDIELEQHTKVEVVSEEAKPEIAAKTAVSPKPRTSAVSIEVELEQTDKVNAAVPLKTSPSNESLVKSPKPANNAISALSDASGAVVGSLDDRIAKMLAGSTGADVAADDATLDDSLSSMSDLDFDDLNI